MTESTESESSAPAESTACTGTFSSTTAPGVVFTSRQALAEHYKSDWHAYNLKRRQAGLPFLLQHDFEARLQAAQALRLEKDRITAVAGRSHLKKDKQKHKHNKNQDTGGGVVMVSQCAAYDSIVKKEQTTTTVQQQQQQEATEETVTTTTTTTTTVAVAVDNPAAVAATTTTTTEDGGSLAVAVGMNEEKEEPQQQQEPEEIDPCQSLFDRHVSCSVADNIKYMHEKYGFFIPDAEYLQDPEGLIGYCHEKLTLGRMCLYCHKIFPKSVSAIQAHMRDAQHCKLRYEAGVDLQDLLIFYDFDSANQEFLTSSSSRYKTSKAAADDMEEDANGIVAEEEGGDEDDGWEDVSDNEDDGNDDDDDDNDNDDDDNYNDLLEQQVQRMGWNVTALGELVFADGRIIGHRALRRYYKQRVSSSYRQQTAAVAAARQACRERLIHGRVVQLPDAHGGGASSAMSAMVAASRQANMQMGIPTCMAMGRGGKGILVPSNGNNDNSSFTQVSLYRFRAVLRQQKRDEMRAQKLYNRTAQNINRMDKKANRLMNNVSVAHAKR